MLIVRWTPATSTLASRFSWSTTSTIWPGMARHTRISPPRLVGLGDPTPALLASQRARVDFQRWVPTPSGVGCRARRTRVQVAAQERSDERPDPTHDGSARILELDPELGLRVPPAEITAARRELKAHVTTLPCGRWEVPHGEARARPARLPHARRAARARPDPRRHDLHRAARRGRRAPAVGRRARGRPRPLPRALARAVAGPAGRPRRAVRALARAVAAGDGRAARARDPAHARRCRSTRRCSSSRRSRRGCSCSSGTWPSAGAT